MEQMSPHTCGAGPYSQLSIVTRISPGLAVPPGWDSMDPEWSGTRTSDENTRVVGRVLGWPFASCGGGCRLKGPDSAPGSQWELPVEAHSSGVRM